MMKLIPALAGAALFAGAFSAANADELRLTDAQMDNVTAGTFGCFICAYVDADASALADATAFSVFGFPTATATSTGTTTVAEETLFGTYSYSGSGSYSSSSVF